MGSAPEERALPKKKKKNTAATKREVSECTFHNRKKKRKAVLPRTRTSLKTSVQHGKTLTRKGREARTSALLKKKKGDAGRLSGWSTRWPCADLSVFFFFLYRTLARAKTKPTRFNSSIPKDQKNQRVCIVTFFL